MVYASTSLALAAIELFVHLEPNLAPRDLISIAAELPEGEPGQQWDANAPPPNALPQNWWSDELAPMRDLGDSWIRSNSSLAVLIPSVPIRAEWNVLINPLHARIGDMKIEAPTPFVFDARMFVAR
jgi:RES domain-containing protein